MALTAAEQAELNKLRSEIGYGPLGEPLAGVSTPTYVPEETKKTAMQIGAESLPMLGSIAATAVAPQVGIPARMAISGLGAGAGDIGKQAIETFGLGIQKTVPERLKELATETGLGVAAEGVGQAIGRGLGRAGTAIRETPIGQRLFGPTAAQLEDQAAKQEVQRMLQRYQSTLGIQEAAPDSTLFKITERIARIGPTKAAAAKDLEMKNAISSEVSALADDITTNVLSREQTGTGLINVQYEGRNALYDDYGKGLEKLFSQNIGSKIIPTVDLMPIQNKAQARLREATGLLKEGASPAEVIGTKGVSELNSILSFKPEMTFQEANEARKLLLKKQRTLETGTPEYDIIKTAIGDIQKQMDEGAKRLSPDLFKQYQQLSGNYKQAIQELDPKILANAANKFPDKVADNILTSKSTTAWKETQQLLNRAKALGVDTTGLAENIQRSYLEKTFADGGITNVANRLKDKATREQFQAILPQAVQNRAQVIAKAGQILGERGRSIDLATAAALSSAGGAAIGSIATGDVSGGGLGVAGGITSLILAPKIAAKIAYSPSLTNKLLSASTNAGKGNTAAASAKLLEMWRELSEAPAQTTQSQTGGQATGGLTQAEQEELQKLRQELGQ
jgi:hypothetical protein